MSFLFRRVLWLQGLVLFWIFLLDKLFVAQWCVVLVCPKSNKLSLLWEFFLILKTVSLDKFVLCPNCFCGFCSRLSILFTRSNESSPVSAVSLRILPISFCSSSGRYSWYILQISDLSHYFYLFLISVLLFLFHLPRTVFAFPLVDTLIYWRFC